MYGKLPATPRRSFAKAASRIYNGTINKKGTYIRLYSIIGSDSNYAKPRSLSALPCAIFSN
jgi:hypothetical protein